MENINREGWEPFPTVIMEDEWPFVPSQIRKHGYRLTRGMEYRPYTMTEIRKYIAEGKMVPIQRRPFEPDVEQGDDYLKAQTALINSATRNHALRRYLKTHTITLSWDNERNRPALDIKPPVDQRKYGG
jgi:hypothetical protein